jgi:hypothetical protein
MFFGGHFNLRKFLLGFFILQKQWHANFLLLCISFLLCMDLQPYSHDHFLKISRSFYASRKSWIILVFLLRTPKEKLPIFLINTLLLHIPLLALMDRQNYRGTELQRNRITEEQIHSLRMGWKNFFSSCAVVSFFCSGGKLVLVLHT